MADILEELKCREPIFHHPEFGSTRIDFENMTAADFWEVGASGRIYNRTEVLDVLEERYANRATDERLEASDFRCRKLAGEVYLLTYDLIQGEDRRTRRATIWERTPAGWKMLYHQGTIIMDAE